MILADFIVKDTYGLYCKYGDFYLDPKVPVSRAVISHAHGDHAIAGHTHVYTTRATQLFMEHRYRKQAAGTFHIYDFELPFSLNGVQITFFPAGHILGSAMVLMEFDGVRYLYTGDYKLESDPTCEPLKFTEADVLLTETTFAEPGHHHPPAGEEIKKLNAVKPNILLGAYALGKSQRLISLLNEHCPQKRILVHHRILPFVQLYEQMGVKMGNYEPYDRKLMKRNREEMVYIVPPMVFHSYIRAIDVVRIFASGWKHLQQPGAVQLYISDHVDWKGILETVSQVKPREVWTTHGSGLSLQQHYADNLTVKLL